MISLEPEAILERPKVLNEGILELLSRSLDNSLSLLILQDPFFYS